MLLRLFFWSSFRLVAIWRAVWRFPKQPYPHISLDTPITNISCQCGIFVTADKPKWAYQHPLSISILQLSLVAIILRIWTNASNLMILYRIFFTPESHLCSAYSFLPKPNLWQSILFIQSPYFCLSQVVIPWHHIVNSLFRSILLLSNMHLSFLHGFSRFVSSYLVPNNIQLSRYITVFMYAFTY